MNKQNEQIAMVYCVTSYGRIIGIFSDSKDAFELQMHNINKGRVAELVPMPIIYPLNAKSNG